MGVVTMAVNVQETNWRTHIRLLYSTTFCLTVFLGTAVWYGYSELSKLRNDIEDKISRKEISEFRIWHRPFEGDTPPDWGTGDFTEGEDYTVRNGDNRRKRHTDTEGSGLPEDFVLMNTYSRIPLVALHSYCRDAKEYCSANGKPGPPGVPGSKGDKGDRGNPGSVGGKGEAGGKGESSDPMAVAEYLRSYSSLRGQAGPKGDTGSRGEPGHKGTPGLPGLAGPEGPAGIPGEDGSSGIPGPTGPRGPPGPEGQVGKDGQDGLPGIPGENGVNGTDGTPGRRGKRGDKGDPGKDGERGSGGVPGVPGLKGTRGDRGPKGYTGDTSSCYCEKGSRGMMGPVGPRGPKGDRGMNGYCSARCERHPTTISTTLATTTTTTTTTTPTPTLPPRLRSCSLDIVGKPLFKKSSGQVWGAWMYDSRPKTHKDASTIWVTNGFEGNKVLKYENERTFRRNEITDSIDLGMTHFYGTGHVVFQSSLYYHMKGENKVVHYDLSQKVIENIQRIPRSAHSQDMFLYSPGNNYYDFAVDNNGLWVAFGDDTADDDRFVHVAMLVPETLEIVKITNTRAKAGYYGNGFVICGVYYFIQDSLSTVTFINYAYDIYDEKGYSKRIRFVNPYKKNIMVSYNPSKAKIFSWDNAKQVQYPMRIN